MTPAHKRLAAAMRDSSASTVVRLALADYQSLVAATAVDHRPELARLRAEVAPMGDDRYLAPDLAAAAQLIGNADLTQAAGVALPVL